MVNNDFTVVLFYGTPAVVSAVVGGAAWWTERGRAALCAGGAAAMSVVRAAVRRSIPAALVVSISVAFGGLAYAGHAPDVSAGQAVHGAVIALVASALALSVYWALGRFVRQLAMLVMVWLASLVPLYFYAFFALIFALTYTQCGPGNPGCLFD
jgi:hypothetical protein